jgi:hypothetical protein
VHWSPRVPARPGSRIGGARRSAVTVSSAGASRTPTPRPFAGPAQVLESPGCSTHRSFAGVRTGGPSPLTCWSPGPHRQARAVSGTPHRRAAGDAPGVRARGGPDVLADRGGSDAVPGVPGDTPTICRLLPPGPPLGPPPAFLMRPPVDCHVALRSPRRFAGRAGGVCLRRSALASGPPPTARPVPRFIPGPPRLPPACMGEDPSLGPQVPIQSP